MANTQAEIIEALIFKMKRMELVLDAVKDLLRNGVAGRSKTVDNVKLVEIKDVEFAALVDAIREFN